MQKLLIEPITKEITNVPDTSTTLSEVDISKGILRQEVSSKVIVEIKNNNLKNFTNINLLYVKNKNLEIKAITQADIFLTGVYAGEGDLEKFYKKNVKLEGIANHVSQAGTGTRKDKVMFNSACEKMIQPNVGISLMDTNNDGRNNLIQYVRDEVEWIKDDFNLTKNYHYIQLTFYVSALIGPVN